MKAFGACVLLAALAAVSVLAAGRTRTDAPFEDASTGEIAASPFAGMSPREIAATLRRDWRPPHPPAAMLGPNGCWNAIYTYALDADGRLVDYFSAEPGPLPDLTCALPPEGFAAIEVAPSTWWRAADAQKADFPVFDLVNLLPGRFEAADLKGERIPGVPESVEFDNGLWQTGLQYFSSTPIRVFMPPEGLEGDFARIYFYVSAVYGPAVWTASPTLIFADGSWPLLTDYGRRLLLGWHRQDPPDDGERARDRAIAAAQGSGNPFVEYPGLAESLWAASGDEPSESGCLKGVYSLSADEEIRLESPFIPVDVAWSVDGHAISAEALPLASLGLGPHVLRYENEICRGALKINVLP